MEEQTEKLTEIEEEFVEAVKKAHAKIHEKLKEAQKLVTEAENISEKYGVPFYGWIVPLDMNYSPDSFEEKWGKRGLDSGVASDLCEDGYISEYGGWEHSAVC